MRPDGPDVEQAVLGPRGVIEGARKGAVVVDMSSINPVVSQKVGAACAAVGIDFLDAPVSGGGPKGSDGTHGVKVAARTGDVGADRALPREMGAQRENAASE